MTVADRKRVYTYRLLFNRQDRKRALQLRVRQFDRYIPNSRVCRTIEARKRAYEILTHKYLRSK